MHVAKFVFNAFQENTYVLYDDTHACAIVDPGCNSPEEEQMLTDFIEGHQLKPELLLNTHCHVDHVLGNAFVAKKYDLELITHKGEAEQLERVAQYAPMYGIIYQKSPAPSKFLDEGDTITFGKTELEVLFCPGHSPASICFVHRPSKNIIAGDVLFQGSIGRVDLPGGNGDTLMKSIVEKLLPFEDDFKVYPGHMGETTIGEERRSNPFILAYLSGQKIF